MSGKQTKDHWAVDQIEDDLPIDLFADLSAIDAASPHHPRRVASGIQKSFSEEREKAGIALAFGNKLTEEPAKRRFVECSHRLQLLRKINFR